MVVLDCMAVLFSFSEESPYCFSLHSHQQCIRVLTFPHPCQNFLLFLFLFMAILTRLRWNLNIALVCILLWPSILSISFYIYWPYLLLLKIVYKIHLLISLLGCYLFGSLVFGPPVSSGY
jgi:hypothetical protein